jgi:hypothetical protein
LWLLFSQPSLYRATHRGKTQIPYSSPDHSRMNFGDEREWKERPEFAISPLKVYYMKDMIP